MTFGLRHPDKLFIDGRWTAPDSLQYGPVLNPATEELLGLAPVGSTVDVDRAITAARRAFDDGPWPRMPGKDRVDYLQAFHDALIARRDAAVSMLIDESGATTSIADSGFDGPLADLRYAIEQCKVPMMTAYPPGAVGGSLYFNMIEREPVGVVAAITAYNAPFALPIWKCSAALAMGNTLVLKPSPFTPFIAMLIAEAAEDADFPPGVFNLVTGGRDASELLTSHPDIDMVSFTGSDAVGSAIMAQAAPTLKRLLLELGGKSPLIVTEDADLDKAALIGAMNLSLHCGQICALATRQIVHNRVREAYAERVAAILEGMLIGQPRAVGTQIGPLISAAQRARVEQFVEAGIEGGGRLLTGGGRPSEHERGFFYRPTLFDRIDPGARIAQDEIFGPVGVILGFDSDPEAIALANGTQYGLSGIIMAGSPDRAQRIGRALRTGTVHVNCMAPPGLNPSGAFGGVKRSGIGLELGYEGLLSYTVAKSYNFVAA